MLPGPGSVSSEVGDLLFDWLRFACAADTLSNDTSRRLYDRYGPDGMKQHAGKHRIASLLFCAAGTACSNIATSSSQKFTC